MKNPDAVKLNEEKLICGSASTPNARQEIVNVDILGGKR